MDCIYKILMLHSEAMEYTCQAVADPEISLEGAPVSGMVTFRQISMSQ